MSQKGNLAQSKSGVSRVWANVTVYREHEQGNR